MWALAFATVAIALAVFSYLTQARFELLEWRLRVSEQETTRLLQLFEDLKLAQQQRLLEQLQLGQRQLKDRLIACISNHTSRLEELGDLGHSLGKQIADLSKAQYGQHTDGRAHPGNASHGGHPGFGTPTR